MPDQKRLQWVLSACPPEDREALGELLSWARKGVQESQELKQWRAPGIAHVAYLAERYTELLKEFQSA